MYWILVRALSLFFVDYGGYNLRLGLRLDLRIADVTGDGSGNFLVGLT